MGIIPGNGCSTPFADTNLTYFCQSLDVKTTAHGKPASGKFQFKVDLCNIFTYFRYIFMPEIKVKRLNIWF